MTEIERGFKEWMKVSSAMPTPADILRMVEKERANRFSELKTIADFDYDYAKFKTYLESVK